MKPHRLHALLLGSLLAPACADSTDDSPPQSGSTTGEIGTSGSTGDTPDPDPTGSSSSGGDTEPHDGFGPAEGIVLEEVVVSQGVAVPVWNSADGFIDGTGRNAPLLQNRAGAVFARFSVADGWDSREITARLHLGEQTLETVMMVAGSASHDPSTWFAWLLDAEDAAPEAEFQVELVEPSDHPSEARPVVAPVEGVALVGFQGPELALDVVFVPITIEAENCNETYDPAAEVDVARVFLLQSLPLQTLEVTSHNRPAVVQLEERGDARGIIDALVEVRVTDELPLTTLVVGVPPDCAGPFDGGLVRGDGGPIPRLTGIVISDAEYFTKNLGYLIALMGERWIVNCPGRVVDNPDPNYPYERGLIGTWGFGILDHQLRDPLAHYSAISNCSPSWVSDYGWAITYDHLKFLNGF